MDRPCPCCNSTRFEVVRDHVRDFEYGAPGDFNWVRCESCGLIALDPQPSDELLGIAYPENYHAYNRPASRLTAFLIGFTRRRLARAIAARIPPGGAILDIGCARGDLLHAIGSFGKFGLYGVEYKPSAAEEARGRGIRVWQGDFEQADIPPESVDVVLMQHVIEHVRDPIRTLVRVREILKPGGVVLGELPNFRSWDAAFFGRYWGGGHAPRHLWFFTPDTLERAITTAGLSPGSVRPSLHTGHWALSIQNFLRRDRHDLDGLRSGRSWYYPPLLIATLPINLIQWFLNRTGVMRFEARKAR